jgi:hypothetical protein
MKQPHAFGCKRVSLKNHYFKIFNQPNVMLVDVGENGTPIERIIERSVQTKDRKDGFDVIVGATRNDATIDGLT